MSILNQILKKNNYRIDKDSVDSELNSHPDFPSFKAYIDSLNHFNIPNLAVKIPKDQFSTITDPVLVCVNANTKSSIGIAQLADNGDVKLDFNENSTDQVRLPYQEFVSLWDGSLIAIEANTKKTSIRPSMANMLFIVLTSLVLIQSVGNGFNGSIFIYSILAMAGLLLSYLIVQVVINPRAQNSKFCTFRKSTDCSSVINSRSSKPIGSLSLSDLSIVFFSSIYLALLVKVNFSVLAWISLLTLPVIIYSIYQQGIVIKKWCPLCLGVGLILVLQFVLSYTYISLPIENQTTAFLLLALSFTTTSLAWSQLKPALNQKKNTTRLSQELKRFKRNYRLFLPYFHTLPVIDTIISSNDIHIGGNETSPVKILVITNPLCKHCFDVHQMLENILEKHVNQVTIDLRFLVSTQNSEDPMMIATSMLKAYKEDDAIHFRQKLNEWYKSGDYKLWIEESRVEEVEDQHLDTLNDHRNWCAANGIGRTPTIIINNRIFPDSYESIDLENMIEGLIEYSETSTTSYEKERFQPA